MRLVKRSKYCGDMRSRESKNLRKSWRRKNGGSVWVRVSWTWWSRGLEHQALEAISQGLQPITPSLNHWHLIKLSREWCRNIFSFFLQYSGNMYCVWQCRIWLTNWWSYGKDQMTKMKYIINKIHKERLEWDQGITGWGHTRMVRQDVHEWNLGKKTTGEITGGKWTISNFKKCKSNMTRRD